MPEGVLYKKYAKFYDKIYSKKDYEKEAEFIENIIKKHKINGKTILDVACGTGSHDFFLTKKSYSITGVDINESMLKIARKKVKNARFIKGNMHNFKSSKKFDILLCLFTVMNYNKNEKELLATLKNFNSLLKKPGIAIFDFGFVKGKIKEETFMDVFSEKNLEIARISRAFPEEGNILNIKFLMLIKDKGRVDFSLDEHKVRAFSIKEVKEAMRNAGFRKINAYENFTMQKYKSRRPVFVGVK